MDCDEIGEYRRQGLGLQRKGHGRRARSIRENKMLGEGVSNSTLNRIGTFRCWRHTIDDHRQLKTSMITGKGRSRSIWPDPSAWWDISGPDPLVDFGEHYPASADG